ncbi:LTA synthase family protein [Citrobacter sp. JGM124]|uniref:LTA synthase family protein n=1 Tax=Citrobacter sp. JGM124 TaxID=2799789 RepID=UPI001BAD1D14|nr:LTA synthase family protein [Citrobacter sp. JGM124]MBS0849773.1 LTA synthase family protein [Citrobacter sp. JGM124]
MKLLIRSRVHRVYSALKKSPKCWVYCLILTLAALIIVSGNSPREIYPVIAAFSVYLFSIGAIVFLTGRVILALSISSLLVILLQLTNQLKIHFYKDVLMFPDIFLMVDPANAETLLHYPLAGLAALGMLLLLAITVVASWRAQPRTQGYRPFIYGIAVMLLSAVSLVSCFSIYQKPWASMLPKGTGVLSNLVMSSTQIEYQSPQFSKESAAYFKEKATALNQQSSKAGGTTTHPDIIVLLQESTVDPHLYHLTGSQKLPDLKMFEQTGNVKAHTPMRVQTFGGGTWLSEFALLTGLRSDDFGAMKNSVFYSAVDHLNDSLFKQMKANGYYTVVLTPFNKSAYNAGHAYKQMGVDKIIQPQELGYPGDLSENLWHIKTADILDDVKKILSTETDKPLFIYALTMYEHGPYDSDHHDDYAPSSGAFSHYVEKISTSDPAMEDFFNFVDTRKKPTIFLHFGDHQPGINWNKGYSTELPDPMYLTQFSLRDNSGSGPVSDLGRLTDIAFLGGMILEQAGLDRSAFYQANIDMRHLCKGELNDCEDKKLVESYKNYIYDNLNIASKP